MCINGAQYVDISTTDWVNSNTLLGNVYGDAIHK